MLGITDRDDSQSPTDEMMNLHLLGILLLHLTLYVRVHCIVVLGAKAVCKSFCQKRWFAAPEIKKALVDIDVDFAPGITALCGSSGSGKSTFAKILHGRFPREEYTGEVIRNDGKASKINSVYLDPFFYLTYDSTKTVEYYLKSHTTAAPVGTILYQTINTLFQIPPSSVINSLLESQKKLFEVQLLFDRLGGNSTDVAGLLILDEYLDKDMTAVRTLFFSKIRELCDNTQVNFQVIIVTHSKTVCKCCDSVIAMKNGFVYCTGTPDKVMKHLPAEFVLLQ